MKYLMEHEMAWDAECLGFPSIQGCHAVVYQARDGLYGYHVAGASGDDRWQPMAALFTGFVQTLRGLEPDNPGSRVYGASFVGNNQRGYSTAGSSAKRKWIAELITYATALHFQGKISGYDLFKSLGANASGYVEYRKNGDKCDLYVRLWHNQQPPRDTNPFPNLHKIKSGGSLENQRVIPLARTVTGVDRSNLVHVHKELLRSAL